MKTTIRSYIINTAAKRRASVRRGGANCSKTVDLNLIAREKTRRTAGGELRGGDDNRFSFASR